MPRAFSVTSWLAFAFLSFTAVAAISLPGCQSVAPQQKTLSEVRTARVSVPGNPFGLVYALQKDTAFVTIGGNLGVLNTNSFIPTLSHQIPLPAGYVGTFGALGVDLTSDGRHLLVAAGPGFVVVDIARAIAGCSDSIVGLFNGTTENQKPGTEAIEVTVSKDDRFAFVSQEIGQNILAHGNVDVFKLGEPAANGTVSGAPVGFLSLGYAVVGTALSPDGHTLYVTSEVNIPSLDPSQGSLSVLDVETLETNPSKALRANVTAGCSPVRNIVSADGRTVWVTARESNHLLAFDAAKLLSDPDNALLASVQVGNSPVGLAFVRNETRILTADSNRFNTTNATTGISVVDTHAALSGKGKEAVLGRIPTGLFPPEFAVSHDGSVALVADYNSMEIQAIDVTSIP